MPDFLTALKLVLQMEGGKVDDPHDPGGRTNQGVTQRVYDAYRRTLRQPIRDVYGIAPSEVTAIYRHQYADPIRFDDLPPAIAYTVFDESVNSGVDKAAKDLQSVLGCKADGVIGLMTLDACRQVEDVGAVVDRLCDARLSFLRRLTTYLRYGKGWSNRVAFVRLHAKQTI